MNRFIFCHIRSIASSIRSLNINNLQFDMSSCPFKGDGVGKHLFQFKQIDGMVSNRLGFLGM